MNKEYSYRLSFCGALVLHLIVGGFLCIKIATIRPRLTVQPNVSIIQAFSVSQSEVETMLVRIATAKQQSNASITPTTTAVVAAPVTVIPAQKQPQPKRSDLDKELKKRIFEERIQEMQKLKRELVSSNAKLKAQQEAIKEQEKMKLKQQEKQAKQALHSALQKELAAENLQLQKTKQQLNRMEATVSKANANMLAERAATSSANVTSTLGAAKTSTSKIADQDQASGTTASGADDLQLQSEIDKYKNMVIQAISQEWIVPDGVDKNDMCKLLITLRPGGVVINVEVIQASKNPLLDRSAQAAILKASPLPVPQDNEIFDHFRTIRLTVRPQEIVSN